MLSDPAIYEYENAPPASVEWLRARYEKLETRRSADGSEQWLNWVIRMTGTGLIGYVQATLHADGSAAIAYEMSSAGGAADSAAARPKRCSRELVHHYGVTTIFAVAKRAQSTIPSACSRDSASRAADPTSARSAASSPTKR